MEEIDSAYREFLQVDKGQLEAGITAANSAANWPCPTRNFPTRPCRKSAIALTWPGWTFPLRIYGVINWRDPRLWPTSPAVPDRLPAGPHQPAKLARARSAFRIGSQRHESV